MSAEDQGILGETLPFADSMNADDLASIDDAPDESACGWMTVGS